MEKNGCNNNIFFIISLPSKEYKLQNDKKSNIEINMNCIDNISYKILETQNNIFFNEEYSILIISIQIPFLKEKEEEEKYINIKYNNTNGSFGNKIKIKKHQIFYYNTKLFPIKNEKNESLLFLPQLNLSYSDEFIYFLNFISNNDFIKNQKLQLKENLLSSYNDDNKKEISFNFLYTIFSLCIELNMPPPFSIINKKILFDNIKDNIKNKKIDFLEKLINTIKNKNPKKEIKEEEEKNTILIISQIFCDFYYRFNNNMLIDLLNDKNNYILLGLLLLIEQKKIDYMKIINNQNINKDNIISFLLENLKDKIQIEEILFTKNDFLTSLKYINNYYHSISKRYNEKEYDFFGIIINKFKEPLTLPKIDNTIKDNNNLDEIILLHNNILNKDISNNTCIINYDLIFNEIIEIYRNTNLITIDKIWNNLISYNNDKEYLEEKYHNIIINLGKSVILTNKEVLSFLTQKDKFYTDTKYANDLRRNPDILISFNLIKDNKINCFDEFKNNKIWNIFNNVNNRAIWFLFVDVFIDKIMSMHDLFLLFELFPLEILSEQYFSQNIIKKLFKEEVIKKTKENNKIENIETLYHLLLKIISRNTKVFTNPSQQFLSLIDSYSFITKINNNEEKIFLYIINLNDKEINESKNILEMLVYFFKQKLINNQNLNLLEFIKLFNNKAFLIELFNNVEEIILNEEDFYSDLNTIKSKYFFDYLKYYYEIIKIENNINETKYFLESGNLTQNIFKNIMEFSFKYNKITELFKNKKLFCDKIISIFKLLSTEETGKLMINTLEKKYKEVEKKINDIEKIYNYLIIDEKENNEIIKIKDIIDKIKQSNLLFGIDYNPSNYINNYEDRLNVLFYKDSIIFISIFKKNLKNNKNLQLHELFINTLTEVKDNLKNLVNKKNEDLENLRNSMETLFEIIENNNIEIIYKDIDFIFKEDEINLDFRNEIKNAVFSISIKYKIDRLIKSVLWILDNFKKYINFSNTSFYSFIKEIYNIFEKHKITIINLSNCIVFFKEKGIDFEETEDNNLFFDFLNLINGQFKNSEGAINFCLNKNEENIKDFIEYLKQSDANFLNLNDINDFKNCCNFINGLFSENINTDEMLIKIIKDKFNKDNKIFYQFKNYLSYYKNIEQIYKESKNEKKSFNNIIKYILFNSKIIIKYNEQNNIICNFKYIIENNLKETLTFEQVCEMRDILLLNYNRNNENNKKNEDIEIFLDLINSINKLIENINKLYTYGYIYNKIINLKIEKGKIYSNDNNKKTELEKIIQYFNELNTIYKKIQFNYDQKNPIMRFIYGKSLILLYNKLLNNNDFKLKKEINILLKYISNDLIQKEIDNCDFIKENLDDCNINSYFMYISKYLNLILAKNKVSLEDILKPNFIKEEFKYIKGGIYYLSYSDKYLEYNIINIYNEISGNYLINNTILICNEEISFENIFSFLMTVFLCEHPVLFSLININALNISLRYKTIALIEKLNNIFNNRKSAFLILGKEEEKNENSSLIKTLNDIAKNNIILLDKKDEKNIKYEYDNVKIIQASKSGLGKSSYIKYYITKESKKEYIHFPIGGNFSRREIIKRLKNLNIEKEDNYIIHLDLRQTSLLSLLKEFLFKLLILRAYNINNDIFFLGSKVSIIIELPFGFVNYLDIIPFLNIFDIKNFDTLFPLRFDNIKEGMKIKDSNIQIVANTLKLYYENKIYTTNIDLESDGLLPINECQAILDKFFKENKYGENYYQKTMLINFLAVQFKMFTECITLNMFQNVDNNKIINKKEAVMINTIIKLRNKIIEAILNTAILATSGPFNKLIEIQNESFKESINFNEIKDNNNNVDIDTLNFDSIKRCLFFFNEDKQFFTIITNNKKNVDDYKLFLSLFNSQEINDGDDFYIDEKKLIDYGNLSHEEYIQELRKILDIPREINIGEIAKKNGNYAFTRDNFIKIILIYFRIKSDIPVILMGETGCGKTTLIKMLSLLINKGKERLKIMNIHGGVSDQDIITFIRKCEKEVKEEKEKEIEEEINKFKESKEKKYYNEEIIEREIKERINKAKIWIFFDEINTCDSLGLISEIMIEKTMNGEKINENFVFIGSCNPYRKITKKMKDCGLILSNNKMDNKKKSPELVYNVNPLPISLINYIFNFGSLTKKDEKIYASSIIQFYFDNIENKKENIKEIKIYGLIKTEQEEIEKEKIRIVDCIIFCHNYLKEKFDDSLISLRDIRRFIIFYDWFLKYLINESTQKDLYKDKTKNIFKDCLNLTIYLCYYLRLSDISLRNDFKIKLGFILDTEFLDVPLKEENFITQKFLLDNNNEIILNRMLRENLLTLFICLNTREPLIIIGKPGTGKTLSINCVNNSMKGKFSNNDYFKRKYGLVIYRYQGSEKTKSQDIINIFKKVRNSMETGKNNNDNKANISMLLFDEMGLCQKGENNPLKVLHNELEYNIDKKQQISFVGISNWRLDSAKMNRVLYLSVTEPNNDELIDTAINISRSLNKELSNKYESFFISLAKTYYLYKNINLKENESSNCIINDFHGNRDFYFFIKNSMYDLIDQQKGIISDNNTNLILTKIGIKNIERNFGGLPNIIDKIKNIFLKEFSQFKIDDFDESINDYNPLNYIEDNLKKINRYLMLINNSSSYDFLLSCILKKFKYKNYILLKGSPFILDIGDTEKGNIYRNRILGKIQSLSSNENIIIMKNLDVIYPFLYNLFNKSYIENRDKDSFLTPISFFRINPKLRIIVLVNNNNLKRENLPFINRFEKHIISIENILKKEYIDIAKEIYNQLKLITSFNNNKKLKINLFNMLIIKDYQDLECLIYKIISKININDKNKINIKDFIYEEILKILVPTFSQDIIMSIKYSGFEKKNKKLCSLIYKIYKDKSMLNFNDFLSKINKNIFKYIIYTFSNISNLSNLITNNNKENNNNFNIIEQIVENIKSENEIEQILNSYYNNQNSIHNYLILHFNEKDIYKLEYITYKINEYESDNILKISKLKNIIFIVHIKRKMLHKENNENNINNNELFKHHNLLEVNNNVTYEHYFIDNLYSDKNYFYDFCLSNNYKNESIKKILNIDKFINKNIYQIFTYFSIDFINERKDINKHNYIKKVVIEFTKERESNSNNNNDVLIVYLKEKIKNIIIKESSVNINNLIPKIFISNSFQINDIDFFEVLKTYIYSSLKGLFLWIIYIIQNNNYLTPILFNINNNINISIYKSIINQFFDTLDIYSNSKPKEEFNSNLITLNLGLNIPGSIFWFKELKNNFLIEQKIIERYQENENIIRKYNNKNDNNILIIDNYKKEYNKLIKNTEEQLKKNIYIKDIIISSQNVHIKAELIYDYIKIYISELSKKLMDNNYNFDYMVIINFIIAIISSKFDNNYIHMNDDNIKDNDNIINQKKDFIDMISSNDYEKSYINNLSSIILFLESYYTEIISLSEIFIIICNYFPKYKENIENIKNIISKVQNENIHKSDDIFYIIIESIINIIFLEVETINNFNLLDFYQFFEKVKYVKIIINKISQKLSLFNDILFSLEILIVIYDTSIKKNDNNKLFKIFIINILKNLSNEIKCIKKDDFNGLSNNIISLQKIIEKKIDKNSYEYAFIMSQIIRIQYNRINDETFRYLIITYAFQNDKLIYESIYFLNELIKMRYDDNDNENDLFNYLAEEKENKYLLFLENINSEVFNQIFLYYLELQFNNYFNSIKLINERELIYLNQAIIYLENIIYNNNNIKDYNLKNIKKIFSISYIKVFMQYYSNFFYKNNNDKNSILGDYKKIENIINGKNNEIRNIIIIYFYKCIYHNNFENIINFNKYIKNNEYFPFRNKYLEYQKQIVREQYVFENCFISPNDNEIYMQEKYKLKEIKDKSFINMDILNFEYYNKNGIDIFYCLFINHLFSQILNIDIKDKALSTLNNFIMEFEKNILNKKLIINNEYIEIFKCIYNQKIFDKIDKDKNNINQNEIEILLYGLRFVLSSNSKDNFYSLILQSKSEKIINEGYVPGSMPFNNIYLNSYYALKELMPMTNENEYGFYVCSCGQYYTLGKCTCPAYQFNCQNCGLIIGGIGHYLEEREDHFRLYLNKDKFNENAYAKEEVISNKIPYMFFDEYKKKYIDKYLNKEPKGININKGDISFFIERKQNVRTLSELSFRLLNFILYSHLFAANIIGNISDHIINKYTYENFSCFRSIIKNWEIINDILKEKNINNTKEFMNIIFFDICKILKECPILDTLEKRRIFEEKINSYIEELVNNKQKLNEQINGYKKINDTIKNTDPSSIEEIILETFPPIKEYYPESKYPQLKYFMKSIYPNTDLLYKELRTIRNYSNKYPLINQLLINNEELSLISNVVNINKLCNKLLNKYSYKISRDDSKKNSLLSLEDSNKNESFKKIYFDPFVSSWEKIKKYSTRYLCRPEMPILTINEKSELNYFLVDDGEFGGGMYLASAYTNFIDWQNKFISFILENINQDSILYCYSSQLNQEIYVQDANYEEVLKFNDQTLNKLNNIMNIHSIRNIFIENDKINYLNYRRIKFNYEEIEKELGKLILPGLKKFKSKDDPIRFVTYLFEGYRNKNSQILSNYEMKYPSRELNIKEKKLLFNFIKENEKNTEVMKEFMASCQILIDYIQKENYNISYPLSDIINDLPSFLELNLKFKEFFKNKKYFNVNTLLSIFNIFEEFCWKEAKENINDQYKENIDNTKKLEIIQFFKNYNNNDKLISKNNLAAALRRLISRYLAGKRGDTDINENKKLIEYITRNDLWELYIIKNEEKFQSEIYTLTFDLKVGQAFEFYKILGEDLENILNIKDNNNNINIINDESLIDKNIINAHNNSDNSINNEIINEENNNIDSIINYAYNNE